MTLLKRIDCKKTGFYYSEIISLILNPFYIPHSYVIGIDIGGSHISGAAIDMQSCVLLADTWQNKKVNAKASSEEILHTWSSVIDDIQAIPKEGILEAIAIAMPGPFDYKFGICLIKELDKYDKCYGINVIESLKNRLHFSKKNIPIIINNDAHCFAIGEAVSGMAKGCSKIIAITLGTGFGAAFYSSGSIITTGDSVPKNGEMYHIPFKEGIAEDYISSRWFLNTYKQKTGEVLAGVKELYDKAEKDDSVRNLFAEFGKNLAEAMMPFVLSFEPQCIVFGGNISKAKKYFLSSLQNYFKKNNINVKVLFSSLGDKAAIVGSAYLADKKMKSHSNIHPLTFRKTNQFLAPVEKNLTANDSYDIYPAFPLNGNFIGVGYTALAQALQDKKTVLIEGYAGVLWNELVNDLNEIFLKLDKNITWYCADAALKSEEEINTMLEPYLGDNDSIFGRIYPGELIDFFDPDKLAAFRIDSGADINIVYGCGSSLIAKNGFLVYADVPKNEIQFRSRASSITNLGVKNFCSPKEMYKRFYYVDWIVLNKHKKSLLPHIDLIADTQRPETPVFTDGLSLRNTLAAMTKSIVRVRPWFEPGVWGGQWIKEKITQLNQEEINYAWSFELITPENGLMLEREKILLEVSFDFLMYCNNKAVLGNAAERFGDEFPIRFDFLDTFSGGNLSLQCHPSAKYIKENFGEDYTQDETYYILECDANASVYLGFQDNIDPEEFKNELEESFETNKEVDVEKFVQKLPAHKHDLFLIPNGTIHCSGVNNLVLEISSTPYIYTFKMYDWLRDDLEGNPRPLNIERAFENLCFDRKGKKVQKELVSKSYLYSSGKGWRCYHLPTHNEHFYDIFRYHINPYSAVEFDTANQCHVMNLVEGEKVSVQTLNNYCTFFHYAETFFVPAAAEKYTVKNDTESIIKVIVAFVKSEKYQ